jgi:hypothetical protein
MPTTVPQTPAAAELRRLAVGQPVSSAHGQRWASDLAHLLAHAVEPVFARSFPLITAGSNTVRVPYARSPGVQLLYVAVELHPAAAGDAGTIALTLTGATLLAGSSSELDGAVSIRCETTRARFGVIHDGYLDVSGVTAGTIQDLAVAWTASVGSNGIYRLHVAEVPLLDVDPAGAPSTEVGVNGAWPAPQNRLCDSAGGVTTVGHGFARVIAQLDKARAGMKRHWSIATIEHVSHALTRTGAGMGALTWQGGSYSPVFRLRARRLYTTATANAYTLRVRYWMSDGATTATFRAIINGANSDLALTNKNGVGNAGALTMATTVPTSTVDQDVGITVEAEITAGAGILYVDMVALIEAET